MIDPALLNLLPPLRRARGDRLYGPGQKHWVDLWKQDGTWLLGRRPEGAAKEWKIQLDKGLAGWAPSLWPQRLFLVVRQLVPELTAVRVFRNLDRCPPAPLWRPWAEPCLEEQPRAEGALRLVLPTGPGQATALGFTAQWAGPLPENDVTSPAEAAGLVHAAAEVLRFTKDPRAGEARAQAGRDFDRHIAPTGLFRRRGLWFEASVGAGAYEAVFRAHLEAGFLLNPDPQGLGILPTSLSPGEWAQWKAAASAIASGGR